MRTQKPLFLLLVGALAACEQTGTAPAVEELPDAVLGTMVTAINARPWTPKLGEGPLVLAANERFDGFQRYPAEQQTWMPLQNDTAYSRDWFVSGNTVHSAGVDGETWGAYVDLPDGRRTHWQTITFHAEYGEERNCFVTNSWRICNSSSLYVQWYTQSQCLPSGTWRMSFTHNGQVWHTGSFTMKPQIPPNAVPLMDQLQYDTVGYANWCRGPSPAGNHVCDGRDGEQRYTIKQRGCALVSAAMVLGYHGVHVDPPTLNAWLIANRGYVNGNIDFYAVARYAQTVGGRDIAFETRTDVRDDARLERLLCQYGPHVIPVYGSSGRRFPTGHFVAATGRDMPRSTFQINDPAGGVARTLASYPRYENTYHGIRVFRGPQGSFTDRRGMVFFLHSPADLVITDPQGRRTGVDPVAKQVFREIPRAVYDSTAIHDPTDPTDVPHVSREFNLSQPANGAYSVAVTGTGTGTYTLTLRTYGNVGNLREGAFADVPIAPGVVHTYQVAYDAAGTDTLLWVGGAFTGGGQKASVDAFLSYSAPTERSITLPPGTTSYPLMVFYGATVDPTTLTAQLNRTDVSSLFSPVAGGMNAVHVPLSQGRNVLQLSIRGQDGKRMPRDADRLVFIVP